MKTNILNFLPIISLTIILTGCKEDPPPETIRNYIKNCDDYASFTISNNTYYVQNNVWGYILGEYRGTRNQCIFYDSLHPDVFGWEWNLDSVSKFPAYPRVGYGYNPWLNDYTADNLPEKINSLNSIEVSFNKSFSSDGIYNTSFDLWIRNEIKPEDESISAEIMIWLDANLAPETPLTFDNVLIENEAYSFYKNTSWNSFPIFFFLKKVNAWEGQLNIYPFISYLVENQHITAEDYLALIEFGNEIWSGSGTMEIENFSIEIE